MQIKARQCSEYFPFLVKIPSPGVGRLRQDRRTERWAWQWTWGLTSLEARRDYTWSAAGGSECGLKHQPPKSPLLPQLLVCVKRRNKREWAWPGQGSQKGKPGHLGRWMWSAGCWAQRWAFPGKGWKTQHLRNPVLVGSCPREQWWVQKHPGHRTGKECGRACRAWLHLGDDQRSDVRGGLRSDTVYTHGSVHVISPLQWLQLKTSPGRRHRTQAVAPPPEAGDELHGGSHCWQNFLIGFFFFPLRF